MSKKEIELSENFVERLTIRYEQFVLSDFRTNEELTEIVKFIDWCITEEKRSLNAKRMPDKLSYIERAELDGYRINS